MCVCLPGHVAIEIDLSDVAAGAKERGKWRQRRRQTQGGKWRWRRRWTRGFSQWQYSHYFQFIARKDKNIHVKCTLCPGDRCLSTSAKSMRNLSKHLTAQHGNAKLVAKDPARRSLDGVTQQPTLPKQAKLTNPGMQQVTVTQKEINRLVDSFIVEDMFPLSTIEQV